MHLTERIGILLVIAAAALWATVGVATQLVPGALELTPDLYGFARAAIAGPVLLTMAWLARRGKTPLLKRIWRREILVFALSSVVFQLCLFRSFAAVGVTVTVFLTVCLPPVIAMVWTLTVRRSAVSAGAGASLGLALAGLAFFAIGRGGALPAVQLETVSIILPISASVAFVVMSFSARALAVAAKPMEVAGAGLTLSSLLLLPVMPWFLPSSTTEAATWLMVDGKVLLLLLYLGLGPTALAYVCYCAGMAQCKSAMSGLIATMIEPMVAAALAMAFLHERLDTRELAGCLLLMLSMGVLWQTERTKVAIPLVAEPSD